jgi:hypothetical protein
LASNTKLTRRGASDFITTAIAAEEDGSKKMKKRESWTKRLKMSRPLEASLYSQRVVYCGRL